MLSIFDHGAPPPCPTPFNLAAHVLGRAAQIPDKAALVHVGASGGETITFGALEAAVRGTGTGLLNQGMRPGDIVLLRLGNTIDFPLAYLGAIAAGLVPVPTSSQLTEREVAKIVDDLSPAAVLRDPDVASVPHDRTIGPEALRAYRGLPPCDYDMGDPDRLAYIIYTSGTSGVARAVAHAHRAIWARQMMMDGWYGLTADDRLLHAGAFNWTFTLGTGLMDPWTMGATAVIPEAGTDIADLPQLLDRCGATIFAAAPGVYRKLLQGCSPLSLPRLRHGLCAGEKLSQHLSADWTDRTGTALYEAFGMSECSTFVSGCPANPAPPETLGRPQTGRRVAIVDPEGTPVPIGRDGIIAVHGSDTGLMLGYVGAPEATAARFRQGWFLTGDRGVMQDDYQITYLGRSDDMMNAGGFRVSPVEVETALAGFPGIAQIGVTDVAVKEDVRIIAAFYTAPDPIDHKSLSAFAADRLARYKQPRAFVHVPELPTGANGKLLRRALRDQYRPDPT